MSALSRPDTQFTPNDRRNRGRAPEADVPSPAQGRSTVCKGTTEGRDRVAGSDSCARSRTPIGRPSSKSSFHQSPLPAGRRSARSCFGGAALYAASRFLAALRRRHDRSGFSARHAGADSPTPAAASSLALRHLRQHQPVRRRQPLPLSSRDANADSLRPRCLLLPLRPPQRRLLLRPLQRRPLLRPRRRRPHPRPPSRRPGEFAPESIEQLVGAWASSEADCTRLFQRRGKALAFRRPVDQFAQAAIRRVAANPAAFRRLPSGECIPRRRRAQTGRRVPRLRQLHVTDRSRQTQIKYRDLL